MVIFMAGCINPDNLTAPSWRTQINLPVKDTIYYLKDQIKTDQYIGIDSSGNELIYKVSSEVYQRRFSVNEYVKGQIDGNYSGFNAPFVTGSLPVAIEFKSGASIDSAWIKSGNIEVRVINNTSSTADIVTVKALGILDTDGNQLTISSSVEANDTKTFNRDLTDFTYTSSNQENPNELALEVSLETQIPSQDEIQLEIIITNSDFYYIDGALPETEIKSIRETISLPISGDAKDYRNKVSFNDAKMDIKAIYQSTDSPLFPALFKDIQLTGSTTDGDFAELKKKDGSDLDNQLVENGQFFKQYNTQEHTLSDLFSIVPDSVVLSSDIVMNPSIASNNRGIARDTDSIIVEYFIEAKAKMSIDTLEIKSLEEFDLGDEDITDVKNARLLYELKSELPAAIDIEFTFLELTDSGNLVPVLSKSRYLGSSTVTSDNLTVEAIDIKDELQFSEDEIINLNKASQVELIIKVYTNQENFSAWFGPDLSLDILSRVEIDLLVDNSEEN
jgi:hypothetical protein